MIGKLHKMRKRGTLWYTEGQAEELVRLAEEEGLDLSNPDIVFTDLDHYFNYDKSQSI